MFHLSATIGTVAIYFVGHTLAAKLNGEYQFKATWAIEAFPALILMLLSFLLPESPKWLASKSKWVEAAKTLERVRTIKKKPSDKDKGYVTRAYTVSKKIKYCSYSSLFGKLYWSFTGIGLLLHMFIQLTCVSSLMYFFTYICDMCGLEGDTKTIFVSIQYIMLGILTIVPVMLLDRARRVDFMTYGMVVIGLTFISIYALMYNYADFTSSTNIASPFDWKLHNESASAILSLFLFLVSVYSSSITSVSWLYTSEIFPDEARAKGTAICMCVSWIIDAITTLTLPLLFKVLKFWIFVPLGVFSLLGGCIFLRFSETKVVSDDICISTGVSNGLSELLNPENIEVEPKKELIELDETKKHLTQLDSSKTVTGELIGIETLNKEQKFDKNLYQDMKVNLAKTTPKQIVKESTVSLESFKESTTDSINEEKEMDDILDIYTGEEGKTDSPEESASETISENSGSEESYFSDDWHQNKNVMDHNSNALKRGLSVHQTHVLNSNNSDSPKDWDDDLSSLSSPSSPVNQVVGRRPVEPTTFLQFDTLRVTLRNYYQERDPKKPLNPIKRSKNMLHST